MFGRSFLVSLSACRQTHSLVHSSTHRIKLGNLTRIREVQVVNSVTAVRSYTVSSSSRGHARSTMEGQIEVLLHGMGAIGAFYAFILQRCKNVRLSVTARSNYEAIKANGLLMKSENHGEHRFHPAATLKTPAEAGHAFDFVVCANKATNLALTAEQLAPVVDQDRTTIVLMQNGVGNEDPFHSRFPKCPILSGVVSVSLSIASPEQESFAESFAERAGLGRRISRFPRSCQATHFRSD